MTSETARQANLEIYEKEDLEQKNDVFRNRPPNLWNEPSSLQDEHQFKYSAKPLEIYQDDRVTDLYDMIKDLAKSISSHKLDSWNNIVRRVINSYPEMLDRSF